MKYKQQIATSDIREAYKFLIQYVMSVKNVFEKKYSGEYSCGNISPGYMDFTYFPFFTPSLHKNKIVLLAEMDVLVAVSACSVSESDCNGGECTPVKIIITEK